SHWIVEVLTSRVVASCGNAIDTIVSFRIITNAAITITAMMSPAELAVAVVPCSRLARTLVMRHPFSQRETLPRAGRIREVILFTRLLFHDGARDGGSRPQPWSPQRPGTRPPSLGASSRAFGPADGVRRAGVRRITVLRRRRGAGSTQSVSVPDSAARNPT